MRPRRMHPCLAQGTEYAEIEYAGLPVKLLHFSKCIVPQLFLSVPGVVGTFPDSHDALSMPRWPKDVTC